MNKGKLSKYHISVLAIYIILTPLLFIFYPNHFHYNFSLNNFRLILAIILASLAIFYFLNRVLGWVKFQKKKLTLLEISLIVLYAFAFSLPEELIFRGVIQTFLQTWIGNTAAVIILSALIYGMAHLLNNAHGLSPSKWNWQFIFMAFCVGLLLGFLFVITGSLLMPTIVHGLIIIFFRLYFV